MNAPASPQAIRLADYTVPAYFIDNVELTFNLDAATTRVSSRLTLRRNPQSTEANCVLHGEQLTLISIKLDGQPLSAAQYERSATQLTVTNAPESFVLEIVTDIHPDQNTALEGLYHSGNLLCTQCEAEGFRRITYYPDRPDVMSVFTVTIVASKQQWPILLSNGNLQEKGEFEDGRHWVRWHDPHPKPSYLFALVAGDLYMQQDYFTTRSGRKVALQIYVDAENHDKCDHALLSLKQSMRWDEETYGREYDLDVYMIVAVNDFNMGAMENKGLNVFNAACVLASPQTATDNDFYTIQSIVAHEYFHNWSGNRVTCRDWFQLSLKEGFTVMRDQSFSADLNSAAVQRIDDVDRLRSLQFAEDAGPMAHPVRPDSYIEISNFYTVTIYEKGAEVVRMMQTLVGEAGFRKGTDLYFERHDGQAVTTDDFVKAIEDANQIDLTQFKRWYSQAGTPEITVTEDYCANQQTYTLTLSQSCPATPGQADKQPFLIPLAMGLLDAKGNSLPLQLSDETTPYDGDTRVLVLREEEQRFCFVGIKQKPVLSLLRGFSAPVKLLLQRDNATLAFLMVHDKDSFNRWDAGQSLFIQSMLALVADYQQNKPLQLPEILLTQCAALLDDETTEPALLARMLTLPSENYLAAQMSVADVDAVHQVHEFVKNTLATRLKARFEALYQKHHQPKTAYQFTSQEMGRRSLKNICLDYLLATGDPLQVQRCLMQMKQADNMTDTLAGLRLMADQAGVEREHALRAFYEQWQHDRQVVDKWLTVQALSSQPDTLIRIKGLMKHPAFSLKNPNNVRAVIGQFCRNNPAAFHAIDGSGYQFLVEQILLLDKLNPQVASRQLGAFNSWRRYDVKRQQLMRDALQAIAAQPSLSADVYEVVTKYLADE